MRFKGKVVNKSVNAEGSSSVTVHGEADASATQDAAKPVQATVTINSTSADLIDNFRPGQSVEFQL